MSEKRYKVNLKCAKCYTAMFFENLSVYKDDKLQNILEYKCYICEYINRYNIDDKRYM